MRTSLFALSAIPLLVSALPFRKLTTSAPVKRAGISVPIKQWTRPGTKTGIRSRELNDAPSVGLGDLGDLIYAVNVNVGGTDVAVHMDTGSADLWVISNTCNQGTCPGATGTTLPARTGQNTGAQVTLNFGDSFTGTTAQGPIHQADTQIAGLTLPKHPYASVDFTNNTIVGPGVPTSGILGLAFPSGSQVQAAVVTKQLGDEPLTIDQFLTDSSTTGPLLTRLAMSGELPQPMFTITLQRNTIDVGGNQGALTLGDLPDGVDNDTLTWVPVRLYSPAQGGLSPPSFAPDEIYPLRWEVLIDNVFFDGKKLPQPEAANGQPVSALIDSGNSLLRGPSDLVSEIFSAIDPKSSTNPEFPCSQAHTLEYEIGGKRFPIDPRDFVSPSSNTAETCDASRLVVTDPPALKNTLFAWSLGDPFFKSNLVAFYFGNLTHPSLDPPRIGFLSTVPKDADSQLVQAVNEAQANGNKFTSVFNIAPTSTLASDATIVKTEDAASTSTSSSAVQTTSVAQTTSTSESEAAETTSSSAVESTSSSAQVETSTSTTSSSSVAQQTSSSQAAATTPPASALPTTTPDAGPSTITNVVLTTAQSTTSGSTTPSPSPSSTSGALRDSHAPVIWTVVFATLVVAFLGM